jgi:hypothetical protein
MLSKQAQDIVTEYKARNDMNVYDEMTWEEVNAYHSWDCTTEEDLISCLDSDYIDMTEEGKIVFITHNFRR